MKPNQPKPDRNRIDLTDSGIARRWSKQFGKSVEEIAAAIEKVGDNAQTVKKELGCELTAVSMSHG
jgi:Protein of unknown function (DUF3606)